MDKYQTARLLMFSSIILLGIFLFLWLETTYQSEVNRMEREARMFFINSAQEVENKKFKAFLIEKGHELKDMAVMDSASILSFVANGFEGGPLDLGMDSISIEINTNLHASSGWMIEEVQKMMDSASYPSGTIHIIQMEDSVSNFSGHLADGDYVDFSTGLAYKAELKEYQGAILKSMWPEITFSFLLLSLIGLAFYFIYNSLIQQKKMTELKAEFMNNMTHELKTPITTVSVAMEALSNFDVLSDKEKTQEYLEISKSELGRLSLLVDRSLHVAVFEKNKPSLKFESLDLEALVKEVKQSMQLQFDKASAEVALISNGQNFTLEGDRVHLSSVLFNLMENALKYGDKQPQIELELVEKEKEIIFKVKDNGPGISDEFKSKIFEKFFRVPQGDRHNVKGHGLGLSYVAAVIKEHLGSIQVTDRESGSGTSFNINLPKAHG